MRPQTPFIRSIETPLSIMKVRTLGDGSLRSTVLSIKGHSLRSCEDSSGSSVLYQLPLATEALCSACRLLVWGLCVCFLAGCREGRVFLGCWEAASFLVLVGMG